MKRQTAVCHFSKHIEMKPIALDIVVVVFTFIVICVLFSLYTLRKRLQLKKRQLYQIPPISALRKKQIPVIESIPFWVPSYITDLVDIEVQPSLKNMGPKFSTPKPKKRHRQLGDIEKPQLKFSVKYNAKRSTLNVNLLESKNLGKGNLVRDESSCECESAFQSASSNVFNTVELTTQTPRKDLPNVKRTRKNSYEFEISYDDLQLQMLQFSVMAYDEFSRQKIIGDVILPMADFTSQGLDVTKELIMWRDVQTMQQRSQRKDVNKNVFTDTSDEAFSDSRCNPT